MRYNYFGTDVRETFRATETIRETFWGMGGDDAFVFYNGSDPDFSDRFIGGDGNDIIQGLFVGLDDYKAYDLLSFDGGAGYDTIRYDMSDSLLEAGTSTVHLGRFTTQARSVEHQIFNMSVSANGNTLGDLAINGTNGDETVRLNLTRSTDFAGSVEVAVSLDAGNDTFSFTGSSQLNTRLKVKTGAGDDTVLINNSTTVSSDVKGSVIGTGGGDDLVVLEGMHKETVYLGGGDDIIFLLTGGFANAPDTISTGKGADRIYMELDEYSKVARIRDFDAAQDRIVFDSAEFRDTSVTFDAAVWQAATDPKLYMDNATGRLWFGDNVMAVLTNGAILTATNFETDSFLL